MSRRGGCARLRRRGGVIVGVELGRRARGMFLVEEGMGMRGRGVIWGTRVRTMIISWGGLFGFGVGLAGIGV